MRRRELLLGAVAVVIAAPVLASAPNDFSTDSMRYVAWERIGKWRWRTDHMREVVLFQRVTEHVDFEPLVVPRTTLKNLGVSVYDFIDGLHAAEARAQAALNALLYGPGMTA